VKNIPIVQDADLKGKKVLLRVDHNVVKKGVIKDPYRIDASLETIEYIFSKQGKPIIMSHVGRPRNKKTGEIEISEKTSVQPIVEYLNDKLGKKIKTVQIEEQTSKGLENLECINDLIKELETGDVDGIYLPNTRWFKGEESKNETKTEFGEELADLADIFVNDAFGSWQPHASTIEPAKHLPSYAGFLMQKEIENLDRVLKPERPLLAVVAGAKFDTKIRPLTALLEKVDYLILGGVIYNAYLCAKYDLKIKGITAEDISEAKDFINKADKYPGKIVDLPYIIESDILNERIDGKVRTCNIYMMRKKKELNYILDVSPKSFAVSTIRDIFKNSRTIFVNAVMGFTPNFFEGTVALNKIIDENKEAAKLFGGGDTLQEFKTLLPKVYENALHDDKYYFFTGGGTILKAIEQDSSLGLEPIKELLKQQDNLTERRTGLERRSGNDRRTKQIPSENNTRTGFKRRSGKERRKPAQK